MWGRGTERGVGDTSFVPATPGHLPLKGKAFGGRGFAPIWDAAVPETDGTTGSEPGRPPDMGHWKYATLVIFARSFAPTPGENPGCLTDTRVEDGMAAWPLSH